MVRDGRVVRGETSRRGFMLQDTARKFRFKAGDVVFIACRVEGYDMILPDAQACILIPIDRDGNPCAHDGWRYYADDKWLVPAKKSGETA